MRWRRRLVAGVLCLGALIGCGTTTGGTARPDPGGAKPASSPSAESSRPREISLEGVDPCSLLTPEQRQALGVDRPPLPGTSSNFPGSTSCGFSNSVEQSGYLVTPVTSMSLAEYVATGEGTIPTTELQIAGFPAVLLHAPPDAAGNVFCLLGVDVAHRQFLLGSYGQVAPSGPPLPQDVLCAKLVEFTTAAMTTLLNQQ